MNYKTPWLKENEVERNWYIIDVKDQILGRVSTKIAELLMGKAKVKRVSNLDSGDYVIVLNSSGVKLSREKATKKMYYSHSGYPGGFKEIRFDKLIEKNPNEIILRAVKNMIPKNKMQDPRLARLFIYPKGEHKHEAQKPIEVKL